MTHVHVVARALALSGREQELEAAFTTCVGPTLKEPGCIRYQLVRGAEDPRELAVIEEWESDEALARHLETPHVLALFGAAGPLLQAPPEIRRYRRVVP